MGIDDRIKKLNEGVEQRMRDAESRVSDRLSSVQGLDSADDPVSIPQKTAASPPDAAMMGTRSNLVHDAEFVAMFAPRASEVSQAMEFIRHSPRVSDNVLYRQRAEAVSFHYLDDADMLNAYATDAPHELPDGDTASPPSIVFFGGLGRALCLTATALALQHTVQKKQTAEGATDFVRNAIRDVGESIVASGGDLSVEQASHIFESQLMGTVLQWKNDGGADETFVSLTQSLRSSMYMFVVAHELGHIAYGHTLGPTNNFEVSRRQEYDADSFAFQVLVDSPFSKYTFLGQLFTTLIFAWVGHAAGETVASTHPIAGNRFRELLKDPDSRSAKEVADEFGLTRKRLESLLP